jgi:hypothetical protein
MGRGAKAGGAVPAGGGAGAFVGFREGIGGVPDDVRDVIYRKPRTNYQHRATRVETRAPEKEFEMRGLREENLERIRDLRQPFSLPDSEAF